jgi:hypothetical protein
VTAAQCTEDQPFRNTGAPKLNVIGDAITIVSSGDINTHFRSSYDVQIRADWPGTIAEAAWSVIPESVVLVDVGTFDAREMEQGGGATLLANYELLASDLQQIGTSLEHACVVWVTINTHNASWGPTWAQQINSYIRATFPHVADWDAAWQASYFDQPNEPIPNETGRQALLNLEDQAIAGCSTSG